MKEALLLLVLLSPAFVFGDYLDSNCGSHIYVSSYGSIYTIGDGSNLNNDCVVHFDRSTYGKISLTITGNSLSSLSCQVNVKDGTNSYSLTGGNINSIFSFTRTVTSDNMGSLYVHVQGTNCNLYGLLFSLSQVSSCTDFTCDNGRCVNSYDVCDNWDDCGDNSDEHNCLTAGPIAGIAVGSVVGLVILIAIIAVVCRRNRTTIVYGQFGGGPSVVTTSNMAVTQTRY